MKTKSFKLLALGIAILLLFWQSPSELEFLAIVFFIACMGMNALAQWATGSKDASIVPDRFRIRFTLVRILVMSFAILTGMAYVSATFGTDASSALFILYIGLVSLFVKNGEDSEPRALDLR